nr:MCP four helix bundle domain-containing protein [Paucibacter sp. M5-1]MCZ7882735.1 MCP four helix bundle domain-containing protein [Paucibacter sp. M5-1]
MGWRSQLSIAQQFSLIVGVAVAILLGIIGLSLLRVQALGATVEQLATDQVERLQLAQRWRGNIAVNATRVFAIIESDGDGLQDYFKDGMAAVTADTSTVQKRYAELETSPEGLRIQEELAGVRKSYLEARDKALALKKQGDMAQARSLGRSSFAPLMERYIATADKMVAFQARRSAEQAAEAAGMIKAYRLMVLGAGLAGLVLLCLLAWVVVAGIRRSLASASEAVASIGEGDLSREIRAEGRGEVAEMLRSMQRMQSLAGAHRRRGAPEQRQHRHRLGRDRQRQCRPEPAHRRAGRQSGADGGLDGGADQHRQEQCRHRPPGRSAGQCRVDGGGAGRQRGGPGGRDDAGHLRRLQQDHRHHRRD